LDATSFYDRLAPFFDVMTDWASRLEVEEPFLLELLQQVEAGTVLDAACGSGGHSLSLARSGYRVVGTDISPAMIRLAQAKATPSDGVSFHVASLGDLSSRFPPFDAALCLGNSLPHLLTDAELAAGLADLAASLRPGGLLLLHNLNYDRRWAARPRWFGVDSGRLDGRQALVWRFADYLDGDKPRIDFHIALFQEGEDANWSVQVNTTPQRPLFKAELDRWLPEVGLTDVTYYGDLTGAPFCPESSPDLVVTARRSS
jgi:glycine/sarcosine N-methyltransferase